MILSDSDIDTIDMDGERIFRRMLILKSRIEKLRIELLIISSHNSLH